MINGLSLFSNVGIAETYLEEVGVKIVVANEILEERARFYSHLYPDCEMVVGDITNELIYEDIINRCENKNIEFIIATPPCQGMSLAGSKNPNDERNYLITYVVNIVREIRPKFVLIENVPQQLKTEIFDGNERILIPDYIERELGEHYIINENKIVDSKFYGVPQQRKRAIFLLVRRDEDNEELNINWEFPEPDEHIVTLREAIGDLPSLDPLVKEAEYRYRFPEYEEKRIRGLEVSRWHYPQKHVWRNVEWMMHTPTGKSARQNEIYYPVKADGTRVKGAPRTYMRMDWDRPAPTVTIYNNTISSYQNVHPGRYIGNGLYSDARVLSILELMRITTLPDEWNIPNWASEKLIRTVIGEGIPPLLVRRLVEVLNLNEE